MEIKYQMHEKRHKLALAFWRQVVRDFNKGKTAKEIADFYVNPKTGKHYTRAHIYWILEQMKGQNI